LLWLISFHQVSFCSLSCTDLYDSRFSFQLLLSNQTGSHGELHYLFPNNITVTIMQTKKNKSFTIFSDMRAHFQV
jgi:hypothetical protein